MWLYFIVAGLIAVCLLKLAIQRNQCQISNVKKHWNEKDYTQKVKKINEAKSQILKNGQLREAYEKMICINVNPGIYGKQDRSKAIMSIIDLTNEVEIATAVCALAQMEANKRKVKNDG